SSRQSSLCRVEVFLKERLKCCRISCSPQIFRPLCKGTLELLRGFTSDDVSEKQVFQVSTEVLEQLPLEVLGSQEENEVLSSRTAHITDVVEVTVGCAA